MSIGSTIRAGAAYVEVTAETSKQFYRKFVTLPKL